MTDAIDAVPGADVAAAPFEQGKDLRSTRRRRSSNALATSARRLLTIVATFAAVIAMWQLLAETFFDGTYALASPLDVTRELSGNWHGYWPSISSTTRVAIFGFAIGNTIAIALAVVVVQIPIIERPVTSIVLAVYSIPMIALAPIIQVLLREGDRAKVALSAMAVVFTTMVAAVLGLRSVDRAADDVIRVLGGSRWSVLRKVGFRAALPALFAGLRIAAPAAVLGATVAEFLGAERGLGVLIVNAVGSLETTRVWAVAVIATGLSGLGYVAVGLVDRAVNGWTRRVTFSAPPPPAATDRSVVRRLVHAAVSVVWIAGLLLVVWHLLIELSGLDSFFAKGPSDVWNLLTEGPRAGADRDLLFSGLATTVRHATTGFVLGMGVAYVLACLFVLVPMVERAVMPVALTLRSVPILATVPIVILVVGRGEVATTATIAVMSFFPTLVNVLHGLRSARAEVLELLGVYGCSRWTVLRKARVPAAMPSLFASARIAVPASVLGATVVEWLATGQGLGNAILAGAFNARYGILWAAAAILCAVTMASYAAVGVLERVTLNIFAPEHVR